MAQAPLALRWPKVLGRALDPPGRSSERPTNGTATTPRYERWGGCRSSSLTIWS